jgi:methylenetetrahydrofolate reductase (NADPH)
LIAGSRLERMLEAGHFTVTGELGPPKGADITQMKHHAEGMRNHVEACNITDNQTAIVRTSSIACGAALVQMGSSRSFRSYPRPQPDLHPERCAGCPGLGIKNILCIAGDHMKFGNEPSSKGVYDIDSMQLLKGLKDLRDEKKFMGGEELDGEVSYYLGAVENPFADPFEFRVDRLEKKIRAGAKLYPDPVYLRPRPLRALDGAGSRARPAQEN